MKANIIFPAVLAVLCALAGFAFATDPAFDPHDLDIPIEGPCGSGDNTLTATNLASGDWYLIFADEDVFATGDIDVFVENVRVIDDGVATGAAYSWQSDGNDKQVLVSLVYGTDGDHFGLWLFKDNDQHGVVDASDDVLDAAAVECIEE
ncbi:MAG: hypothetical protein JXP34_16960 [Planctomycetes bacterium]|nr:hypothetical protein [Planctomycetota bacterium]